MCVPAEAGHDGSKILENKLSKSAVLSQATLEYLAHESDLDKLIFLEN